jgi:tryptophan 2,3-dioxygenase
MYYHQQEECWLTILLVDLKINFQNLSADIVDMINDFQSIKKKHF